MNQIHSITEANVHTELLRCGFREMLMPSNRDGPSTSSQHSDGVHRKQQKIITAYATETISICYFKFKEKKK